MNTRFEVIEADITKLAVDAIVNERIGIDEAITALLSRPFKAESA